MKHYQSIGTGLSFLMHLVFILLIFFITRFTTVEKRIITIDFSINNIKGSVTAGSKDTAQIEKAKQVVKKKEILKEKKTKSENLRQNKMERLTEKRPVEPASPEDIKRPLPPEEMEMPEEPSQAEMTDEPVEENVPEPAVQEPALESSEASVFADEVTDNSDINRDDDIDSTIQDVATSSNNNTSEGKTSSEGIHETASKALPEEGFESLTSRYVKRHFNYIRDMIQGNLSYPSIARRMGWTGKVIVSFVVCKDGRVENIKIVESSGFAILDRNAMETIKKVSPFPRPPVSAELIVPIAYMLR